MKTPVICHLTDFCPEYPGSFVDSLLCLARFCRTSLGVETLCVFPEQARERSWLSRFDAEGIHYDFVPVKRRVVPNVKTLLRDYNPLVFHSHFSTFDLPALFLKFLHYRNAKAILHFHSLGQITLLQRIKDLIKVRLLCQALADRFIAVGDGVFRNSLDRGFPPARLILVYNGIDTHRFCSNENDRKKARDSLGISEDDTAFLLLGYDPLIKGVDIFIKAAQAYAQRNNSKSFFLIIGRNKTREYVAQMPEARQLGNCLRVIDPILNFAAFLNGIDVLVSSSRREGFPYGILEAMSEGKVILCSDIPGPREACGNSQGVWLFPSGDWKSLSSLMEKVDHLPSDQREQLSNTNVRYVASHYPLEAWANKIGEVYGTLLGN